MDLVAAGYERVDQVEDRGQFAVRGGLLDLFPATEDRAVRVDLFGDEIERLSWFSTFTQRSLGDAERVEVAPAAELAAEHRELAEIAALEDAESRPDIAELLPVEDFHPFLDLAPGEAPVIVAGEEELAPALADHWQDVCAAFHSEDAHRLYVAPDEIEATLGDRARIRLSSIDQDQRVPVPRPVGRDRRPRGQAGRAGAREARPLGLPHRRHLRPPRRGRACRLQPRPARGPLARRRRRRRRRSGPGHLRHRAAERRVHRAAVRPRGDPRAPAVPSPARALRRSAPSAHAGAGCCGASPTCAPATSSSTRITASPASPASTPRPWPESPATTCTWSTPAPTGCSSPSTSWRRSAATSAPAARTRRCRSSAAPAGRRSRPAPAAPPRSSPASCSTCTPSAAAARDTRTRPTPSGSGSSRTPSRTPRRPTSATRSSSSRPTWRRRGRWTA